MILSVCERFGKLPSEVYREDARLWRMLLVEQLGKPMEDTDE